jgi:predicted ATPase
MLTKLMLRNFKRFDSADIELDEAVVFVGPNNSGKTTALQALALWQFGLRQWLNRRSEKVPKTNSGIVLNRRDLASVPTPQARLLWHDLRYAQNRIEIIVEGNENAGATWACGVTFRHDTDETIYCDVKPEYRETGLPSAAQVQIALLPPMSGLISVEDKFERGGIQRRIGEGRTAEVLRNLCYQLAESENTSLWEKLKSQIKTHFAVELQAPYYNENSGALEMSYLDGKGTELDLSSSGRGMLQVLLILAYMYTNPNAVLLLDEPDAHLEVIRQTETYQLIKAAAQEQQGQIIAASHSEQLMNLAAETDTVIAFVGKPHVLNDRNQKHILAALNRIPAVDYFRAEQTGWVCYLEGSTDLEILQAFAERLGHPAARVLQRLFFYDLQGDSKAAEAYRHFDALVEAKPDMVGVMLLDRQGAAQPSRLHFTSIMWRRYEIENYLSLPEVVIGWARATGAEDSADMREQAMHDTITELEQAYATLNEPSLWSPDRKASHALETVFKNYARKLGLYNPMTKGRFHELVRFLPAHLIDPEVTEKLDAIVTVASQARPRTD